MLLKYELKKTFNKRINKALFILAILLSIVFSIFAIGSFRFVESDGSIKTGVSVPRLLINEKNKWAGELTPKVIYQIAAKKRLGDWQSTSDIVFSASEFLRGEYKGDSDYDAEAIVSEEYDVIDSIYEVYKNNLKKASKEYSKSAEQQLFLEKQYEKIKLPFYYEAADSWDTMFLYVTTMSIILAIISGFLTAGIFADELHNGTDLIFFSSKNGRRKAIISKIIAGLIITTAVYGLSVGIMSLISFGIMGISGISTPYQLYYPYSIYNVTFGQMYAIVVCCGYIASLLSASVAMFIVSKTRSIGSAIGASFALFCISPFIGRAIPFKIFFSLTPDQLNNIMNCSRIPYIYQIGNIVFPQISFIMVLYIIILIVLIQFTYKNYRKLKI